MNLICNCFKSVAKFPPVALLLALFLLSPILDVLTDILTASNYVYGSNQDFKWACILFAIVFLNFRFMLLFATLHPKPTARNVLKLYVPLCVLYDFKNWLKAGSQLPDTKRGQVKDRTIRTPSVIFGLGPCLTSMMSKMDISCICIFPMAIMLEIILAPLSVLAVWPICVTSCLLFWDGCMDACSSATTVDDDDVHELEMYVITVNIVESLLESLPQLVIQVYVYYNVLAEPARTPYLFFPSITLSAFAIAKAISKFVRFRPQVMAILGDDFSVPPLGDEST